MANSEFRISETNMEAIRDMAGPIYGVSVSNIFPTVHPVVSRYATNGLFEEIPHQN